MDSEDINLEQSKSRWFIDMDWYQRNGRSFSALAEGCLCPRCYMRLKEGGEGVSADSILSVIGSCCSQTPGFITPDLPVLSGIFRLLLAGGNQPQETEELGRQLYSRYGGGSRKISTGILYRLLCGDCYYGFRRVK